MKHVPVSRWVVFLAIAGGGLAWDLYSKWLVFDMLGGPERETEAWGQWLWGDHVFRLRTSLNHGALFGMGQGYSALFAVLSLAIGCGILYWLFVHGAARCWWLTVALACVMSGALGNLYDRLGLHGLVNERSGQIEYAVRDFLYFELINWPIFNFADTFLVTGAIMLAIQSLRPDPLVRPDAVPAATPQVPAAA